MTTLSDALARAPNPLAAHTVSDGDGGTGWVDVPALHSEARAALLQGCERARHGHSQVFALVGEAGLGKSHLLLWLRQRLELRGDPLTYFIGMPALPDLAQPFRHALRQLVGALCRRESTVAAIAAEPSDPQSGLLDRPIDSLLWGALYTQTCDLLDAARVGMYQGPAALLKLLGPMCSDAGRRRPLADFAAAAQKVWGQVEPGLRSYLLSLPTEMSIDSAARAVLLQYPYADRRGLCTAWLAGEELSQKDRERLSAKQVINNENAAKYVLGSVVRLLTAPPGAHLVLHYDQTQQLIEQLGQPGLQAMGEVVAAIQSCGGSSLQVLALRPEHLSQLQGRAARPAVVAGPIKNLDLAVRLGPVGPELLREVVAARLAAGLAEADDRPSPLYPLTEAELGLSQWPKEADTPRAALQVFAKRYSERRRELVPGAGSAKNAVSTPDQKRSASGPARAKDAPSIPGTPERRSRSSQSPSLDFLSDEETSDALAATPVVTSPMQGVRARSLTHPDESGGTAATAKLVPQRASQGFVADSSPTIQALPKSLLVSATGKVQGREVKPASSFAADSSPTQRAVSDDVMGKVQGPGAASKRSPEGPREAKPAAVAPPSRAAGPASEDAVMGRVRGTAKAADKAPEAAAPAAERLADKPAAKLPDKPAAAPAAKPPDKPADKPAQRSSAPAAARAADSEPGLAKKNAASAVPHVEADSSPTLKRVPDEHLIKASRDRSRPHSDAIARKAAPSSDSDVIGRPTPTMQTQPSLVRASKPSAAPAKPAVSTKPVAVAPPAKPPAVEEAPPAPSNVPDPLPPSSESPSMGWLAMANDQSPLADAVKQAKADLAAAPAAKPAVALSEPPRPAPSTAPPARPTSPTSPPQAAPAKAPSAVSLPRPSTPPAAAATKPPAAQRPAAATVTKPPASVKTVPPPALAPPPADNVPTELPPSAESPSMGWLAMASGSNQLDDAVAQAKAELASPGDPAAPRAAVAQAESASGKTDKSESGPNKARSARPIRGTASLGVVVVNPTTVKPAESPAEPLPEPAARAPVRSTQARMPAIQLRTAQSVSPQQVLAALGGRGMMEDWQLAQDLGLPLDSLEKILVALEEEGQVRLMAMGDGQRMVVLID